jgi:hypothetical protein
MPTAAAAAVSTFLQFSLPAALLNTFGKAVVLYTLAPGAHAKQYAHHGLSSGHLLRQLCTVCMRKVSA